jgi:polyribonucleotide nucleotidyltransferase
MEKKTFRKNFAGKELVVEFSPLAQQADASCLISYGETVALVTVVVGKEDRLGIDFVPLSVEYEEKYYAAGKIYGSRFVRRETRPTETAVLAGRLVDRSIRPLFNKNLRRDVQVVITVLSIDNENDPEVIALLGASLVLHQSGLPFSGPVSGVRLGKKEMTAGPVLQPSYPERENAYCDAFFAGTENTINMIEISGIEAKEDEVYELSVLAQQNIKELVDWQKEILKELAITSMAIKPLAVNEELRQLVREFIKSSGETTVFNPHQGSHENFALLQEQFALFIDERGKTEELETAKQLLDREVNDLVHDKIIKENRRPDGRALEQIRPLEMHTGFLPRTHGSAIFMRGETHALSVITLGAPGETLVMQGMETTGEKRFIHHYNFPPYSTGETGPFRGPGRREIGHGALAERAVLPLIPSQDQFPYTIRAVTEILSSNGSSSMASVCGTSLALMNAGVPIKKHIGGIAMGLMSNDQGEYKILTDIQGPEDHYGDMDCKVAGTADGITAVQMDVKIFGITLEIFKQILSQAKQARQTILEAMIKVQPEPRPELSPYAPRIITLHIPPEKIGEVIGGGGKTIQGIIKDTNTAIDIEDDGTVFISGTDALGVQKAQETISAIVKEFQPGEIINGTVIKFLEFGALISLSPNKDALLHISEITPYGVSTPEQLLRVGQALTVKITEILPDGKIRLTLSGVDNPDLPERKGPAPSSEYHQRPPRRQSPYHRSGPRQYHRP